MPIVKFSFPTEEEQERTRRFQVHKNYLGGVQQWVNETYDVGDPRDFQKLIDAQSQLKGFNKIQKATPASRKDLRKYLMMSWASEAQLRVHEGAEATILPYANAWAPVHSYYAVYMGTAAWLSAQGHGDVSDHATVLAAISNQVSQRKLFPPPWSANVGGCPELDEADWEGLVDGADPTEHIEVLENPSMETFWPRYAKMLETTRSRKLKSRYADWCKQNDRKNTKKAEKRAIAANLTPTTLFDFFWRLRVRSNYQDVEVFLMSSADAGWQRQFHDATCFVTEATSLLLENLIIRRSGLGVYEKALDDFNKGGGSVAQAVVEPRQKLFL